MKQLLQNMRDGKTQVVEVPVPQARRGTALVQVAASLVSAHQPVRDALGPRDTALLAELLDRACAAVEQCDVST